MFFKHDTLHKKYEQLKKYLPMEKVISWKIKSSSIYIDRPLIMGILNITPDSFYDGGKYFNYDKAIERGKEIEKEGADIIDIGGESTRPGSAPVSEKEEIKRVIPVIENLSKEIKIPISCDTYKSKVAEKALQVGAEIINDISGLRFDKNLIEVIKEHKPGLIIMHTKGKPKNMQKKPYYKDTINEIYNFFKKRLEYAIKKGISEKSIVIDPGIGFGKRLIDNLLIIKNLSKFKKIGRPILIGTSRKSFIGKLLNLPEEERLEGTIASIVISYINGAKIFRVHDVKEAKRALDFTYYIFKIAGEEGK